MAEDTGGAFFLFEDVMARGKSTPLHRHPEADETVYVLEGEILVNVDGKETRVGAGGMTFTPRGVPHAFLVVSDRARLLTLQTPGIGQAFYRDASEAGRHDRHRGHRSPPSIGEGEPPRRRAARTAPVRHVTTRRELDRPVAGTAAGVGHARLSLNGQ